MDPTLPIVKIAQQRGASDCGIAVLAMYLGLSYEDVLVAAGHDDQKVYKNGMWDTQIIRVAKVLGFHLTRRRHWDLELSNGILSLSSRDGADHIVLLRAGMIVDTDGTVWEPELFLRHYHYTPGALIMTKENI